MPNCSDHHHGRRPYPLCLARPDLAGRIRTRSRKTSDDYDTRYTYLAVSTARALGREPSIFDVASHVRSRAPEIRYGSYRNYKAAVLHHARVLWNRSEMTEEDVEEVARTLFVPGNDQGETLPFIPRGEGPVRCGHRRAKTITEAARDTLVQRAESLASRTGEQLRLILRLGPHCGLRPTEWTTAELCGTALLVRCAKFSDHNGRGTGATNVLQLPNCFRSADELGRIGAVLATLRDDVDAAGGNSVPVVARLARALRSIRDSCSRVVLRTTRHQARANMTRAGFADLDGPPDDRAIIDVALTVAASMGHRSTDSQSAYGRTSRGWQAAPVALPDPASLGAVQIGPSMRGKLARGEPLSLLAAMSERRRRQEADDTVVTALSPLSI